MLVVVAALCEATRPVLLVKTPVDEEACGLDVGAPVLGDGIDCLVHGRRAALQVPRDQMEIGEGGHVPIERRHGAQS